jgi:hypothetical protein
MRKPIILGMVLLASVALAEIAGDFYVYKDAGTRENHFCPSGWMGSFKSLKMNTRWITNPKLGSSCIRIDYDIHKDTETTWAGIYFQQPVNNWGDKKGGYDLTGYTKLKFWVKGEGFISTIGMGGITGTIADGDSDNATVENIDLTPEWKEYVIDLKGLNLSHIIGGFYFSTSADNNDKNVILYLDDVRYTK